MGPEASTRTEGPLDGPAVREMFAAATRHLELHAEAVNALNVFPVPDGDTGTNMLLTMQAAMEAIPDEAPHARDVLSAMAHGSLMGARGNSGVILSQIVRGFHLAAEEADVLGGRLLTDALREGAARAYQSVTNPVEGTMLTVARQTAEACEARFGADDAPPADVLAAACEAAESSLARTPLLLEVLRENGVVDSGGRGVVVILEGALCFLTGAEPPAPEETTGITVAAAYTGDDHGEDEFGFCSEWIVERSTQDTAALREMLGALGTSLVVAGDLPFLSAAFLRHLAARAPHADAVVPRNAAGLQPLCAVYDRGCAEVIRGRIERGRRRLVDLAGCLRVTEVGPDEVAAFDPDGMLLFNVNTRADHERAIAAAGGDAGLEARAPPA